MEATILLSPSPNQDQDQDQDQDQSISRNKQIRSSKNCIYRRGGFISRSSDNFAPLILSNIHGEGEGGGGGGGGGYLFGSPQSLYYSSLIPSSSLSILGHHHHQQQPPLLPLPVPAARIYSSLPAAASRNYNKSILQFSPPLPPNNRKNKTRTRDQDLTPKKPKSSINYIRPDSRSKITTKRSGGHGGGVEMSTPLISSTNRLGPEPGDIPKEVSAGVLKPVVVVVMTTSSANTFNIATSMELEDVEVEEISVSGSIFSLAPPPSSLPLPKFSVTPRLRCNVEAAGGIDAGATDNLRRLLRLR